MNVLQMFPMLESSYIAYLILFQFAQLVSSIS